MRYEIEGQILTDIADSIREKTGKSALIKAEDMADEIEGIKDQPILQTKTATQNGTVTPDSGYDGLSSVVVDVSGDDSFALTNYIESTGTQWIDTGYIPKAYSEFEVVTKYGSSQPSFAMFFGALDDSSGLAGRPVLFGPGSSGFQIGWGFNLKTDYSSEVFRNYKIIANVDKNGYDVKTTKTRPVFGKEYSGTDLVTTRSIYLFSLNAGGSEFGSDTRCRTKLYRFRIKENGTVVHEYIPWTENGIACLKDTVTDNLLYNAGTGNFVYGTDS